jgi:hypothetical protein
MTILLPGLFQIVLVLLLADFVAGLVHWLEDAYVREDTPLIGSFIGRSNVIHHHLPRYLTRNNWWQSSWDTLAFSTLILLVAWQFDLLTWQVGWFAAISANANEIHKWSHRTRRENGRVITFLQSLRLVQTPQHHAVHHTNPKNVRYCPITNLVNPVLDRLHFWDACEWLLAHTVGMHRQPDTSLPGHGPTPEWLRQLRDQPKPAARH